MTRNRRAGVEHGFAAWIAQPRHIAKLGAGIVALAFLVAMGLSDPEQAPEVEKEPVKIGLEPDGYVILETSWNVDDPVGDGFVPSEGETFYADSFMSDEEKKRAEEARERWQNLDIAVRR